MTVAQFIDTTPHHRDEHEQRQRKNDASETPWGLVSAHRSTNEYTSNTAGMKIGSMSRAFNGSNPDDVRAHTM